MQMMRRGLGNRRANLLIEFAIVFLLLYMIIGGILTFGKLLFAAQTINQAADNAARELARTALPATATFEDVRDAIVPPTEFRTDVYSEDWLAIDITPWILAPAGLTLYEYLDSLPMPWVNRQLVPLMFMQAGAGGDTLLRYPGALVTSATAPSGYSVEVPVVLNEDTAGNTTVRWVRVLEEMDTEDEPGDNTAPNPDPFSVISPQGGVAALRLNYPYQSEVFSTYLNSAWVAADDTLVTELNSPFGTPVDPGLANGPYSGEYGLGRQLAWGTEIRPFHRLVSAQAVYRREIFE